MDDNFSIPQSNSLPQNQPNTDSGISASSSFQDKFAPPPSNVFIRTSETDLEKMQSEGGVFASTPSPTNVNFPSGIPVSDINPPSFSPEPSSTFNPAVGTVSSNPSSNPMSTPTTPENINFGGVQADSGSNLASPFSPVDTNIPAFSSGEEPAIVPSFSPAASGVSLPEQTPSSPQPAKKFPFFILVAAVVIIGAVAGYLFIWPRLFKKTTVITPTTTSVVATEITTTTLSLSPTTVTLLPPTTVPTVSPFLPIGGVYQKNPFSVNITGEIVLQAIKDVAKAENAPAGTFKILIPQVHGDPLKSEEVILSLIPKLPERLKPYLLGRPYLVYTYYGETNPALGLIVDVGTENVDATKEVFLSWEKNLNILNDVGNFFLTKVPTKTAKSFTDKDLLGSQGRVYVYNAAETAFVYTFFNQYLIITASEESAASALEHLQQPATPIYP